MPDSSELQPRRIEFLPLGDLRPDPRNPKSHDLEAIDKSIGRFGVVDPIVIDGRTGFIISGHGRTQALAAMEKAGGNPPEGVRTDPEGRWLVPVSTGWASRSDAESGAALIALNRTTELGGWVDGALLNLLDEIDLDENDLDSVGFTPEDLTSLRHATDELDYHEERQREYVEGAKKEPQKRLAPIDLIFSTSAATSGIAIAGYNLGWHPGIITSSVGAARLYRERFPRGKRIMFMDNEWQGYNHAQHVEALAEFHPKYATARDLVTRAQAAEFGVEYYSVEETLAMAEEIAPHCDNVILIPKYDCLDRLPR